MMASKTVNTRIQLKSDTEANWKKSVLISDGGEKASGTSFVPLLGELIVYTADDAHPFSRLKVGDGETNVLALPFIDAQSIQGLENFIIRGANRYSFPAIGQTGQLYIDLSTSNIYYWSTQEGGYIKAFQYNVTKETINTVTGWDAGTMTTASIQNTSLVIENGTAPELTLGTLDVVTNISEVGTNG